MFKELTETIERSLENLIFAARWLLAPFYVGLALAIGILLIKFMVEFWHLATHAFTASESDVILGVLALVDLALMGSLLIIVIFSGYENFVSKIDHSGHRDWPEWMGTIDFSALKLKLLSSIVAISAIHLLKQFMSLKNITPEAERSIFWLVVIHVVFVVSSVLLALSDRIASHAKGGDGHGAPANGGNGHDKPAVDGPVAAKAAATPAVASASGKPQQGKGGK